MWFLEWSPWELSMNKSFGYVNRLPYVTNAWVLFRDSPSATMASPSSWKGKGTSLLDSSFFNVEDVLLHPDGSDHQVLGTLMGKRKAQDTG